MSELLDQAFDSVRGLPAETQNDLARLLLRLVGDDQPPFVLPEAEAASLAESLAQSSRGEYASDEQIRSVWAKTRPLKVRYTPKALAELHDILAYIAERSSEGMLRVRRRLQTRIDLIAEHPRLGQATSEPRLRRVVVTPYPYLVFYEVKGDEIVIVGVRHGARERGD